MGDRGINAMKLTRLSGSFRRFIGIGLLIVAWQALATFNVINPFLLPPPSRLVATFWDMLIDGSLLIHAASSLERVVVGFAAAAAIGTVLGVVLGWWPAISEQLIPVVEAVRPIPPIAWTPLAILWFGIGNAPSYFLVFIGAVFPVFINTFAAVRGLDRTQVNAALCLGAGPRLLITDVVVPASLPVIFPGLRIALGVGWMCVVAAELIAAQSGLGYLIQQSRMLLQTQVVLTGMITIGMIGFAMNAGMVWLERRLIPWKAGGPRS
ncbi:ABC transporter permease [Bradyrhizobium lablabi]|uniref:ABC transporter permease n=1 Tax=Bradyrhizobium lablabi TaxID=722472 RepID=UPI001BA86378|nr:ABC transporter permease [Bradyrhizobium lablabi]MBR1125459.1 ABC transporter permease [Bradyrhizobium lablabi]